MASQHLVRRLTDVGIGDRHTAGGKGASLGELARAGLRVPAGYVITAAAFERAITALDPAGETRQEIERMQNADSAAIARAAAAIRHRIATAPLPGDVREAITAGYRELAGAEAGQHGAEDIAVAVRSSATSEDSQDASFAGLADTFLWVRGAEAVADRARRCWASLYNTEAVTYRLGRGIAEQDLAMAVVVQEMADPLCAGVMFTCSPVSGDRSVVAIEGSWGLGSVLVSGEVTPDSFVVSKVTGEIMRRTVGTKLRLHRPGEDGSGVTADDVAIDMRDRPCMTDDQIRALAEVGRQIERHYGRPQDIEWAIDDAGIVVLQSRDETVWSGRAVAPVATAKARAVDHVFEHLSRVVPVAPPER